ncbi:MAG: protein phosphatase CheZ [Betaproteobacteria bacterium]|nr:protein phosphatase CheZ [Betaproteobacteria bacterium]
MMGAQMQEMTIGPDDLDALFEQAAERRACEPKPAAVPLRPSSNDPVAVISGAAPAAGETEDVYQRIGQLTRVLHDALCELGYDKTMNKVIRGLPDARDRLNYIAQLTGQAAEKALNCVDRGQELQAKLGDDAKALADDWGRVFAKQMAIAEIQAAARRTSECLNEDGDLHMVSDLAQRTREFLDDIPHRTGELSTVLLDIMMAQDFHDLTGQVIKKIVELARFTEEQLIALLVHTTPPDRRAGIDSGLSGPVVNAGGRADVVTDQTQVDELLEKLGF